MNRRNAAAALAGGLLAGLVVGCGLTTQESPRPIQRPAHTKPPFENDPPRRQQSTSPIQPTSTRPASTERQPLPSMAIDGENGTGGAGDAASRPSESAPTAVVAAEPESRPTTPLAPAQQPGDNRPSCDPARPPDPGQGGARPVPPDPGGGSSNCREAPTSVDE